MYSDEVRSVGRSALREFLGEVLATGALVAVVFASGAVRVQLGSASMAGALLGSVALGLGYGIVLWSFGRLSGAQSNPLVSIIASILGGQPWRRTVSRVGAQVLGAGAVGLAVARFAAQTFIAAPAYVTTTPWADAIASFGFVLVALGVAHRRDASVPAALGAFAIASFWMTGRATVGNPVLSVTVLCVATARVVPDEMLTASAAATLGAGIGSVAAKYLFPDVKAAAAALLFAPRGNNP